MLESVHLHQSGISLGQSTVRCWYLAISSQNFTFNVLRPKEFWVSYQVGFILTIFTFTAESLGDTLEDAAIERHSKNICHPERREKQLGTAEEHTAALCVKTTALLQNQLFSLLTKEAAYKHLCI